MAFFLLFLMEAVVFAGSSEGAGVLEDGPLNASVGGAVMFITNVPPTEEPFQIVLWNLGNTSIITSLPTQNTTGPEYVGRITLFPSTGSLELRNLTLSDSGMYTVSILPLGENIQAGSTRLDIYEPVSDVTVTPQSADLVEFSGSVNVSCSASGLLLTFLWMNSSSEVTSSDRVLINTTEESSFLTIINVTRYDHGLYSCFVLNPASDARSDQVNIFISFGPENTTLNVSPSKEHYVEGSDITLGCSAESRPSAEFTWFLNGDQLPDTGPELNLKNIQIKQSGNYSCQAFNDKTGRYQTSHPSTVAVLAPVSDVTVAPHGTDLVEFNSTVSLSCSSFGPSLSFFWTNSSSNVTASDRVQISVSHEGSNMTIVNVTRHDKGPYICNVFNLVSNNRSDPVNLPISYGPENIQLKVSPSKETYPEGSDISLSCSADSEPVAHYLWLLDGNRLSNTGSELSLTNIQANQTGDYSCQSFNSKTMRYITSQPSAIVVHESTPSSSSSGLSTGIIVAIVIVCLAFVIGLGVGYYIKVSKKPWKNPFSVNTSRTTGGNKQSNEDNSSEEINYARLKFPKKTKVKKNPAESDNPLSEYAQVRVNNNRSAASWPPADEQSYAKVKIPTNKTGWVQQAETGFSSSDYAQIRVNSDRRPTPPPKTYKTQIETRPAPQPAANNEPVYGVVNKSQRR